VLGVIEPETTTAPVLLRPGYFEREERARVQLTNSMQEAIDDAAAPVEISGELVDGYADEELARLSHEVDLLVCGSRGHGPLSGVILGSVSAGVLRKARCPVLVVPRGAHDSFAALHRAQAKAAA
jgi:nucleotide-binding universal stress UspA family protein